MQLHHAYSLPFTHIELYKIIYGYNGSGRTLITIDIYCSFPYWGILMVGMKAIGLETLGNTTSTVRIFQWIGLSETTIFPSNRSFDWNAIGFAVGVHGDAEVKRITSSTGHKHATDDSRSKAATTTARRQRRNDDGATTAVQQRRRKDRYITAKRGNDTVGGHKSDRKRAATDTTVYRGPCAEDGNSSSCIQPLRFQSIDPFCIVCFVSILSLPYV